MRPVEIKVARLEQMPVVRALFEEYQAFLGVDLCFQGFNAELDSLPGKYAEPAGFVLLAMQDEKPCGCVAVRPFDDQQAELKRLFVKPAAQGGGTGRRLFNAAMEKTKSLGYQAILLDTLPQMKTAQAMYLKRNTIYYPCYRHGRRV